MILYFIEKLADKDVKPAAPRPVAAAAAVNRWDGEDEDDDIKVRLIPWLIRV